MATKLVMPRLGWTMEEGIFVEWHKKDGDRVEKGDILFSIEGDKAIQEVEAFTGGFLHIQPNGPNRDDVVQVGIVLGYLLEEGEKVTFTDDEQLKSPAHSVLATADGDCAPVETKRIGSVVSRKKTAA